jgi:mono/diheme cytochrome c family protein
MNQLSRSSRRLVIALGFMITLALIMVVGCGVPAVGGKRLKTLSAAEVSATLCSVATNRAGAYVLVYDIFWTPTVTVTYTPGGPTVTPFAPTLSVRPEGSPDRGLALFHGLGTCIACHNTGDSTAVVGPSLMGIARNAGNRHQGMTAAEYIRNVIINPDVNVVPNTKPGIMPSSFARTLNQQQIEDIISYLLTLN